MCNRWIESMIELKDLEEIKTLLDRLEVLTGGDRFIDDGSYYELLKAIEQLRDEIYDKDRKRIDNG